MEDLKRDEKTSIDDNLKQTYLKLQQIYLKQEEKTQEEQAQEEKANDLSLRIIEYKARTDEDIVRRVAQSDAVRDAIASLQITPDPNRKKANILKLEDYLLGNYAAQIVNIGLRAGLFRAIDAAGKAGGISDNALAKQLGFAPIYVQWWCKAAYAFELLDCNMQDGQAVYTLDSDMATLLLKPGDLDFLGDQFLLSAALFQEFHDFPTYLHTGQIKSRSNIDSRVHKFYQNLSEDDASIITHLVLEKLPKDQVEMVLDIGTGAGAALVHYATYFPKAKVVGLDIDLPTVLLAQRTIAQAVRVDPNLDGRIEVRLGDANQLTGKDIYDLITINLALHEMGIKYRNVLQDIHQILKPGGVVVICEFYAADGVAAYRNPVYQQWLSLHLHEVLLGSNMLSSKELQDCLKDVRFKLNRIIDHPINGYLMVLAEKEK